jgi:hypothetical protein
VEVHPRSGCQVPAPGTLTVGLTDPGMHPHGAGEGAGMHRHLHPHSAGEGEGMHRRPAHLHRPPHPCALTPQDAPAACSLHDTGPNRLFRNSGTFRNTGTFPRRCKSPGIRHSPGTAPAPNARLVHVEMGGRPYYAMIPQRPRRASESPRPGRAPPAPTHARTHTRAHTHIHTRTHATCTPAVVGRRAGDGVYPVPCRHPR